MIYWTSIHFYFFSKQVAISRIKGATILAVGVADYNKKELVNISGSERNFFPVNDFSELEKVRDKLRDSVTHANLEGSSCFVNKYWEYIIFSHLH